jgi:hypothetical protein
MDITEKEKEEEKIVYKAGWDNLKITKKFYNIVVEEIDAVNMPLGTLNARCYKNLGEKFFARTGKKIYPKIVEESLG